MPISHLDQYGVTVASANFAPVTVYSATSRGASNPNVLKKFKACHQCRKRKLVRIPCPGHICANCIPQKCDGNNPCKKCIRSYEYAVAHPPKDSSQTPAQPDCTFDPAEISNDFEPSSNDCDLLENRIKELEALLHQHDSLVDISSQHRHHENIEPDSSPSAQLSISGILSTLKHTPTDNMTNTRLHPYPDPLHFDLDMSPSAFNTSPDQALSFIQEIPTSVQDDIPQFSSGLDMIWPDWPPDLPTPGLLRHLVVLFFTFHPHSRRLFHAPSFMASMLLPPSHPNFPIAPVLHAICALSPLYTAAVTSPPQPNFGNVLPGQNFSMKNRDRNQVESFAERHARLAEEAMSRYSSAGQHVLQSYLLQVFQANIIMSWYYWCYSKWVEVWRCTGNALAQALPLGLNSPAPFGPLGKNVIQTTFVLSPARSVVDDETRRNAFWLAYAAERMTGFTHGWSSRLDDKDISQFLPARGDKFENGDLLAPSDRQWMHEKDIFLVHPEDQSDAFSLYIKGTMLITRTKNFNRRFQIGFHTEYPSAVQYGIIFTPDPRESPVFKELDTILVLFKDSFPAHLQEPIVRNTIDLHLYAAFLLPLACSILLHEPHADREDPDCVSTVRLLQAAYGILDLIHAAWSTNYDVGLLDLICPFTWLLAGQVLAGCLKVALDTCDRDGITTLSSELHFIQCALGKVSERIPIARERS